MRDQLRALLLLLGFAGLVVAPFVVPSGRTRVTHDPHAAAVLLLTQVGPGMRRVELESTLHRLFRRADGVEVFAHPESDVLRLDVRLDSAGQDAHVVAVGSPYLSYFPTPDHLR